MNKRGEGIQFNWIFVIIAGAIILGFFTMFVFKYIDLQVAKENVEISRMFSNTILALEGSSSGGGFVIPSYEDSAFNKIKMYANVAYNCSEEEASFIINNEEMSKQTLLDELVFSPDKMYINKLNTWIYPWKHPFFISNVIYLAPPEKKFFIVYDSSTQTYVDNLDIVGDYLVKDAFSITTTMNKEQIKGDYVGVIWITQTKPSIDFIKGLSKEHKKFSFVYINEKTHKVTFYENGKYGDEFDYIGDALLFGAIFSESSKSYSCSLERAKKRLKSVTKIINGRIDLVSKDETTEGCGIAYSSMKSLLDSFSSGNYFSETDILKMNDNIIGKGCNFAF